MNTRVLMYLGDESGNYALSGLTVMYCERNCKHVDSKQGQQDKKGLTKPSSVTSRRVYSCRLTLGTCTSSQHASAISISIIQIGASTAS